MFRRRRPLLRAAAVGGVAYAAGHHVATKSAEQQYTDVQENAQIADLQQQLILERTWLMKPSSYLVRSTHAPYSYA